MRGHPVNLWRKTSDRSRAVRRATNACIRSANQGVASAANRSRTGSTSAGLTSRASASYASDGANRKRPLVVTDAGSRRQAWFWNRELVRMPLSSRLVTNPLPG